MDPLTPGWTTGYGNLEWEFSGGRIRPHDNAHHSWSIDQDDYSATDIQAVKVSIQSGGGSFRLTEGTRTPHFGS